MIKPRHDAPSSWKIPVSLALVGYMLFIAVRLYRFGGDPSGFICAGLPMTNPETAPPELMVHTNGPSYDGQYFYRIALDPFDFSKTDYGITLDNPPYRQMRIGYPILCRLAAGGQQQAIPVAMIAVNVLWLGALGWIGIRRARNAGNPSWWGLLPLMWPGLLVTLGRDLAEIQSATLLVLTLHVMPGRPLLAAAFASLAVLTRETVVAPLLLIGLVACVQGLRQRTVATTVQYAWLIVPALFFTGWHTLLYLHHGVWPVASVSVEHRPIAWLPLRGLLEFASHGFPFSAPVGAHAAGDATLIALAYRALSFAFFFLCIGLAVWCASRFRSRGLFDPGTAAWLGALLPFIMQVAGNWMCGPSGFLRLSNEMAVCGLFLISGMPAQNRGLVSVILGLAWLAGAGYAAVMP